MYGGGEMPGGRAGSGVGKYNAESPQLGNKRFNSIMKKISAGNSLIGFLSKSLVFCNKMSE